MTINWKNLNKKYWIALSLFLLAGLFIIFKPGKSEDFDLPQKVDFNYHIRPILSQNCFLCHGPDSSSRKADLRLDNFEGATALLEDGGAAIMPGNVHKSVLINRVSSTDPDVQMPPPEAKKVLSPREIALLKRWIKQGAKWKTHWAFIPPESPSLRSNLKEASPSEIIDHLIDKKLKSNKLTATAPATKNALIRRVSYLLTGLPPDPKDVEAFLADSSPGAYEKMADQYLASPHFGERWARHWMDLTRYGEHLGHEFDYEISGAWQYRDYLIRAFNQDVPYDLFVKEHLAGDMLSAPRYHPEEGFNESVIGTAYFFMGEGKHSPVSIKQEEADRIDNMIDVTSKTFQALTVGCARCHDHKFDPIPTTDYYAMYGMIESARFSPIPARTTLKQEARLKKLETLKGEIRSHLGSRLRASLEQASPRFISQQKQFIQNLEEEEVRAPAEAGNYKLLGDFRTGSWEGWYNDGAAFGAAPLMGEPAFNKEGTQIEGLVSGAASSRAYASGLIGALRSPNFIIEQDFIVVRAAGLNGSIRIIVDNFQLIQNPLYGSLQQEVNDKEWQTYKLDVSMLKGHKAYVQFMPGGFPRHAYLIQPEDYIEVQYVLACDGEAPVLSPPESKEQSNFSLKAKEQAIADWMNKQANYEQVDFLNAWLKDRKELVASNRLSGLIAEYRSVAAQLYDSTHFIGLTEGEAVFSSVFIRGSVNQLSEEKVPRQFLHVLKDLRDTFPQTGSGRLAWAESVVDPANPLTARVMVNRIWRHLFGRGIVETVDNFGLQGKLPTHPELLDYLAVRFMEEGWSMKSIIKHILLSESFRRATTAIEDSQTIDPNNHYLHHFPLRRLEAEAIRDGMLAVSGRLDLKMYGEPVPIHLTEFMTGRGRPGKSGPLDGRGRRSIYVALRRNFLPPMMLAFDMPIPFSTFGNRNTTNVPAQSLTLLNDPFVHQQAEVWAEDLLKKKEFSVEKKIQEIYLRAFSRLPTPEELKEETALLENLAGEYEKSMNEMKDDSRLWKDYCHTVFNLKEFIHLL